MLWSGIMYTASTVSSPIPRPRHLQFNRPMSREGSLGFARFASRLGRLEAPPCSPHSRHKLSLSPRPPPPFLSVRCRGGCTSACRDPTPLPL